MHGVIEALKSLFQVRARPNQASEEEKALRASITHAASAHVRAAHQLQRAVDRHFRDGNGSVADMMRDEQKH